MAKRLISGQLALRTEETMCFHDFNVILENVVNHIVVMRSAREKFQELDVDRNGYLEGFELDLLVNWMLASFCPNGEPLPLEEKELIKEEMMRKTDENGDGRINMTEFSVLFEEMTMMLTLPLEDAQGGDADSGVMYLMDDSSVDMNKSVDLSNSSFSLDMSSPVKSP